MFASTCIVYTSDVVLIYLASSWSMNVNENANTKHIIVDLSNLQI